MSGTLGSASETGDRGVRTAPFLARILDADAPLAPLSWHSLDGVERVELRRSDDLDVSRAGRALVIGVPDRRMSEHHARLEWLAHHWVVRDLDSKNGVRIEGAQLARGARGALDPGDVFECGRSFFLLGTPAAVDDTPDFIVDPSAPLATLSPALAVTFDALDRAAPSALGLVVVGETGTGKELVARAAHTRSGRPGAFVAINCGALPGNLLEDTLFGHLRGAFSGAASDQLGALRAADRGTLFLDELADLSHDGQTALLRALQEREVVPLGATRPVAVDLRVVVATRRPLAALVADGILRPDLAHRLAGVTLALPALRDRRVDLGLVAGALLHRMPAATRPLRLAPAAARALLDHEWPGNVRELARSLELAALHAAGATVELAHLALPTTDPSADLSPAERARRDELTAALTAHRGNISAVARALSRDRVQIRRWLERFGLDPEHYRAQ